MSVCRYRSKGRIPILCWKAPRKSNTWGKQRYRNTTLKALYKPSYNPNNPP